MPDHTGLIDGGTHYWRIKQEWVLLGTSRYSLPRSTRPQCGSGAHRGRCHRHGVRLGITRRHRRSAAGTMLAIPRRRAGQQLRRPAHAAVVDRREGVASNITSPAPQPRDTVLMEQRIRLRLPRHSAPTEYLLVVASTLEGTSRSASDRSFQRAMARSRIASHFGSRPSAAHGRSPPRGINCTSNREAARSAAPDITPQLTLLQKSATTRE